MKTEKIEKKREVDGPAFFEAVYRCDCGGEVVKDALEYPNVAAALAALKTTTPRQTHICANGDVGIIWLQKLRRVKE